MLVVIRIFKQYFLRHNDKGGLLTPIISFTKDHVATIHNEWYIDKCKILDEWAVVYNLVNIGYVLLLVLQIIGIKNEFREDIFLHLNRHKIAHPVVFGVADISKSSVIVAHNFGKLIKQLRIMSIK